MADDSDTEKTEPPTTRRLEKAREDGQVARSRELSTFLLLVTALAGLWGLSGWIGAGLARIMHTSFSFDASLAFDTSRMMARLGDLAQQTLIALAPLGLALTIVALIAPMLMGGWLFSGKSIKVDITKLDPFKGLARLFSLQAVAELGKALAKSLLVGAIAAWFIHAHLHELLGLAQGHAHGALRHALRLVVVCCGLMLLAFIVVVGIDVPYQLYSHTKKLRMSLDEIKKEHKETEGDPQIKGKIRQQQQAMARARMMSEVADADVIVTNPTHFAVALAYRDGQMSAPKVVAKGIDHIAERIRDIGAENNVPGLAAPPLARALYRHADLDAEIPAALYTAVAEVLAWVYQLKRQRQEGGPSPAPPAAIEVPADLADPPLAVDDNGAPTP